MAKNVFPTENTVGSINSLVTNLLRERNVTEHSMRQSRSILDGFVSSGMALSAGSGLEVSVATGNAIINGYWITISGSSETCTGLTASRAINTPNFIYAELSLSSNLVTSFVLTNNITGTQPANSVFLGIAATDGSSVIQVISAEKNPVVVSSTYTGNDSTADRNIILGFQPKFVRVTAIDGTSLIVAESGHTTGTTEHGTYKRGAVDVALTDNVHSQNNRFRPELYALGFKVKHGTATPPTSSLNKSGVTYRYLAWV